MNQIATNLRGFVRHSHLKVTAVVGGQSINAQTNALQRGTDILVATPGRLLDLVERKAIRLDTAKVLILDEADQMLDLGFNSRPASHCQDGRHGRARRCFFLGHHAEADR